MGFEFFVILGDLIVAISLLPQIIKVIKTKQSDDLSQYMMLSWIVGNGLILTYTILAIKDLWLILLFLWNIIIAIVLLILYYIFRRDKND